MSDGEGSNKPVVVNSRGMIGSIEPYVPGECFEEYKERLELFFELNDVVEEKRVAMLITLIGPDTYRILKSLVIPAEPKKKKYEELVAALTNYFAPTVNVIAERYKFQQCVQASSESISDYIVALKTSAQSCKFENFLDDALRDRFVAGIQSSGLRALLLKEKDLKFQSACALALNFEMAESGNSTLQHPSQQSLYVNRLGYKQARAKKEKQFQQSASEIHKTCHLCGKSHDPMDCPARNWECFSCGKKGHTSFVCRSKPKKSGKSVLKKSSKIHKVKQEASDSEEEEELFAMKLVEEVEGPAESVRVVSEVSKPSSSTSLVAKMEVLIEEKSVTMEVDTGASTSVMPLDRYVSLFSEIPIQGCSKTFVTLTGDKIKITGQIKVRVRLPESARSVELEIVICECRKQSISNMPLIGRPWLDKLIPEWRQFFDVSTSRIQFMSSHFVDLDNIQIRFPNIFSRSLSDCIRGYEAEIVLKPDAVPIFH